MRVCSVGGAGSTTSSETLDHEEDAWGAGGDDHGTSSSPMASPSSLDASSPTALLPSSGIRERHERKAAGTEDHVGAHPGEAEQHHGKSDHHDHHDEVVEVRRGRFWLPPVLAHDWGRPDKHRKVRQRPGLSTATPAPAWSRARALGRAQCVRVRGSSASSVLFVVVHACGEFCWGNGWGMAGAVWGCAAFP